MKIKKAIEIANRAHEGQVRKKIPLPFVTHPMSVMKRCLRYVENIQDEEDFISASVTHDVKEDCLEKFFNEVIALGGNTSLYVEECSREGGDHIDIQLKIDFLKSFKDKDFRSCLIKLSDRVDNVLDYLSFRKSVNDLYFAKYALQAWPLIMAIVEKNAAGEGEGFRIEAVFDDILILNKITIDNFGLSLLNESIGEEYNNIMFNKVRGNE